jgi:hypothetical protein
MAGRDLADFFTMLLEEALDGARGPLTRASARGGLKGFTHLGQVESVVATGRDSSREATLTGIALQGRR